jgi:hypothetical protein
VNSHGGTGASIFVSLLLALFTTTPCIVVPVLAGEGETTGLCEGTGHEGGFFCDDFSSGTAGQWEPQVGTWTVEDGEYVGEGTFDRTTCSGLQGTLIRNLEASNVDIRVDMRSIQRVDKGIILRSNGPDNQIELNFRADPFGDLVVQQLVDCKQTLLLDIFQVLIPHQVGETIHTRVKLIRNHLQVWINGGLVLNRSFPFTATRGGVGLTTIDGGITAFDNVEVHEPIVVTPRDGNSVTGPVPIQTQRGKGVKWLNVYIDGTYLASSPPFNFSWDSSTFADGEHKISAVAYGRDDQVANSDEVTVKVTNPAVKINQPATGSSVSGIIAIDTERAQEVEWLNLYIDGKYFASSPPFSFKWNSITIPDGTHSISAKAYRGAGTLLGSAAVTFQVQNCPVASISPSK